MCGRARPLRMFRSYNKREFSNHPDYQQGGKYSYGLKPSNNPHAEICAGCGYPKGKHLSGTPICPYPEDNVVKNSNIKSIKH